MPTRPGAVQPAGAIATGQDPPALRTWPASGFSHEDSPNQALQTSPSPSRAATGVPTIRQSPVQTRRFGKRLKSLSPAKKGPPRSERPSRGLARLLELFIQGECCMEEVCLPECSKCGLRTAQRSQRQPPITTINSPSNFLSATASNRDPTVPRCTRSCSFVKSFATAAGRSPYTASASARNAPSRCWLS